MKLRVWTRGYRPFILGGNVHAPLATDLEVHKAFKIGRGLSAYVVINPVSGQTHVAESTTGAFVGDTIAAVRKDMEDADPKVVKEQMKWAAKKAKKARVVSTEEFWRHLTIAEDKESSDSNESKEG